MLYVFDFCGTLINKQTHQLIKFFAAKTLQLSYFKKYLGSTNNNIAFDIEFLNQNNNRPKFVDFLLENTNTCQSFTILEKLSTTNSNTVVLTAACEETVKLFLSLSNIEVQVVGSKIEKVIRAEEKSKFIGDQNDKAIFFTDHENDYLAIEKSHYCVLSEYRTKKLENLILNNPSLEGKFEYIENFILQFRDMASKPPKAFKN